MKILILSHEFGAGGSEAGETCSALLQEYARNSQFEIDLVTNSADDQYHVLKMGENVNIYQIPFKKKIKQPFYKTQKEPPSFVWQAYKFCRKLEKINKYDLAHVFFSETFSMVAFLLNWQFKLPYIISLQGSNAIGVREKETMLFKLKRSFSQKGFSKASFVIANSQWLKSLALSVGLQKEIEIIYNGVDLNLFCPDFDKKSPENFELVCVSEVVPIKGIRTVIQALKFLTLRYEKVRLMIVGDGSEKQSLSDLARALEIRDKVEFFGAIPFEHLSQFYQKADLAIVSSLEEGMDESILEAYACGLPIVAAEGEISGELIHDNINGLVVKKNDPNDLAEKIEKLMLNEELLNSLAKGGYSIATSLGWKKIADQYLEFYVKTVNISRIQE